MKFQINKDVFSEAVSFAVKLLPQRTTLPILTGVLVEAKKEGIVLSSFDYEVSSTIEVGADVEETGKVLISGKLLSEIAQRLPNTAVFFSSEESHILIQAGSAKFSLLKMPMEEYPRLPEANENFALLKGQEFSSAIAQVAVAASRDDVTPVITGVQLEITNNTVSLMATDRYRVAIRTIDWDPGTSEIESGVALIPAKTLQEVGKSFGNSETVTVSLTKNDERELIAFSSEKKTITSLLIKGTFPPVKRLFPEVVDNYAVINTAELVEATRRVSLVLDRDSALRFSFASDTLLLEAVSSEHAQASESIDCLLTGTETVVSLKPQFLLDGLGAVRSEFVRISFTKTDNPNKPGPVLITSQFSKEAAESNQYQYLLQPNLLLR